MGYGIDLSTKAQHDLTRLPMPVRQHTFGQLQNLADAPTSLSRPSRFPFPQKCQLFDFAFESEGRRWGVYVLFQFGQDEQTLHVLSIGFESSALAEDA